MEFRFLDPGPLIDRELELVAPEVRHVEDMLAACTHPLSRTDAQAHSVTRERLAEFLRVAPGGHQRGDSVPAYHFWMRLSRPHPGCDPLPTWGSGEPPVRMAGGIGLRIGRSRDLEMYFGHVGYNVLTPVRGNHYAERACRLLLPLARSHGMESLWITCNPENIASRRTCERLGCRLVETVPVPVGHSLYIRGERHKCRYLLELC
jgi:RimJ/RimL family protein N-acetyltransferase